MPPSGGGGTAQLVRQLADQMRQVQDTVAALAGDNTALKIKVAVLEASVERLRAGPHQNNPPATVIRPAAPPPWQRRHACTPHPQRAGSHSLRTTVAGARAAGATARPGPQPTKLHCRARPLAAHPH